MMGLWTERHHLRDCPTTSLVSFGYFFFLVDGRNVPSLMDITVW
jgi:hypothetical protein